MKWWTTVGIQRSLLQSQGKYTRKKVNGYVTDCDSTECDLCGFISVAAGQSLCSYVLYMQKKSIPSGTEATVMVVMVQKRIPLLYVVVSFILAGTVPDVSPYNRPISQQIFWLCRERPGVTNNIDDGPVQCECPSKQCRWASVHSRRAWKLEHLN